MAAGENEGAAMIVKDEELHREGLFREDFRPPVGPLQNDHPTAVNRLFNACRERFIQATQPIHVHVKQGGPALVLVDESEGRAGHDRFGVHSETKGNPFGEPGFAASQFTHEADHIALQEETPNLLPEPNRVLIRLRRDRESFFFQIRDKGSFSVKRSNTVLWF